MLGHGDCGKGEDGYSDCNMDRGRVERRTDYVNRHKAFYTFSIYVPKDFNPIEYGASKAALIQMTKYLACNFSPKKIRVNCVSLGPFPNKKVSKYLKKQLIMVKVN